MTERRTTYTANPSCEVRDECYLSLVRNGVHLEVPRLVLNTSCGFEICKTLEFCPRRRILMRGSEELALVGPIPKEGK